MEKYRDFFGMKEELESSGVSALELHTYELMLQERADIFPTAMNREAAVVAQLSPGGGGDAGRVPDSVGDAAYT